MRGQLHQIQGLILSGYGDRPAACYAVFRITDAAAARAWLKGLVRHLQFGEYRRTRRAEPPFLNDMCVNIAFTHRGFAELGLDPLALAGFSLPFQEGMAETNRARRLGDDGASSPDGWEWGGPKNEPVHGVLLVFAGTKNATAADYAAIEACIAASIRQENGVARIATLRATPSDPKLRKEHFGFRDGIANPRLQSLSKPGAFDAIADGEIVLGYENGYARYPMSPAVPPEADPRHALPRAPDRPTYGDFGRNGSYLVFRQLEQNVSAFWEYLFEAAARIPDIASGSDGARWLAARMVGRWPNGTPLARYPGQPGPESHDIEERFLYGPLQDPFGVKCPIGSHIRRTNPRDTALPVPHDPDLSGTPEDPRRRDARVQLANKHRIMRRGRSYGPPIDPAYEPERLRAGAGDGTRGLHFLCFVADLNRQFEFVQSNWAMNPTFAGLSRDPDPLLGPSRTFPFPASDFTIQGCPARRVRAMPRVVEVRGGAYFFMPSRTALEYVAAR